MIAMLLDRTSLLAAGFVSAFLPTVASADALSEAAGRYEIQSSSRIAFRVGQVGGGGIKGRFGKFAGSFRIDGRDIGKSEVKITLYPASVEAGEGRVTGFLTSDAVFNAAAYPEITFRSTKVSRTGDSTATIDGVLNAHGKSKPARFLARLTNRSKSSISFHISGKVLRSPFGMDVGTPIYSNVVEFDMELRGARR
jgi:polyisoprenoid-binding protein YceI